MASHLENCLILVEEKITTKLKYLNLSFCDLRNTSPAILAQLVTRMEEVNLTNSSLKLQGIVTLENEDDMSLKLLDGETLYIDTFSDLFYQAKGRNTFISCMNDIA